MLGFFLGADWSVCVLRRTNHRQGEFVFSSDWFQPINCISALSLMPIGRGKKGKGGTKPRRGIEVGGT